MADKPSENSGVIVEAEANLDAPTPARTDSSPENLPPTDSSSEHPTSLDPSLAAPANSGEPAEGELDDITEELARIERMTQEEAAAIPSLDDGNDDAPEDVPPAPVGPNASGEFDSQDDELAAALAEVEQISVKPKGADKPEEATRPPEEKVAAKPSGPPKPPQFKIGKQEVAKESTESSAALPKSVLGQRLYNFIHEWLDRINRPFGELSAATRTNLGYIALTTIVVSVLVIYLMPIVYPNRDAIQFVQERRAALDQPPPPPEEEPGADAEKKP